MANRSACLFVITLVFFSLVACRGGANGKLSEDYYASVALVELTEAHTWPFDLPEKDRSIVLYPDVNPRMAESDSISLSWWYPPDLSQSTYHVQIYVFSSEEIATDKFGALKRHKFTVESYILPQLFTQPLEVFMPEVTDVHSPVTNQDVIGCVAHDYEPPFTGCTYIGQYKNMVLTTSIVLYGAELIEPDMNKFEELVRSSQSLIESHLKPR